MYSTPLLDWGAIAGRLEEGVTMAPGTGGPDRHSCWLATVEPGGATRWRFQAASTSMPSR